MLDHYIQKDILYNLAFAESLKFSELKPGHLDNKLFIYHLKKLILANFVVKTPNGTYTLTSQGRRVGKGALKKDSRLIDRAYSILLLVVKRQSDDAWLLVKRRSQPLLGLTGFLQAQPLSDASVTNTAKSTLKQKTDLSGDFSVKSSGFFKIYKNESMESFLNFTLLVCENAVGELVQKDELGEYLWDNSPDFSAPSMVPTAQSIAKLVESDLPFVEETFHI